jgi:hypothetical protein
MRSKQSILASVPFLSLGVLMGCTVLPCVVFSNPTASTLAVDLQFSREASDEECTEPRLSLMPSSHAKRRWRPKDRSSFPPDGVKFDIATCTLTASILAARALEVEISDYFEWSQESNEAQESNEELLNLTRVSLSGELGSVEVSGPLISRYFEPRGVAYYVWEYGRG